MSNNDAFKATVANIERMAMPDRLTDGLTLDSKQRALVDAAIERISEVGYAIIEGFFGSADASRKSAQSSHPSSR